MKKLLTISFLLFIFSNSTYSQTRAEIERALNKDRVRYNLTVVVEKEMSEILKVDEKTSYGSYAYWQPDTRHIDILKVYHPKGNKHYSFMYIGDLSWSKGDTLEVVAVFHKKYDKRGRRDRVWTDYEMDIYLDEGSVMVNDETKKRFHDAIIKDIIDIIPAKQY